jgi:NAD(P)-dependent dehydrogenase (short-subunit alcohol dehydrogenase family)
MANSRQVVIVTGGGTGIGRAAVLKFAENGFTVVASGRRLEKLQETSTEAYGRAGEVIPFVADVSSEADVRALVEHSAGLGELRYLVNNAGVGWDYGVTKPGTLAALGDTTAEHWREVMSINLDSVYLMCHATLPHLRKSGGSIVNVSSTGGLKGMADAHAYATAKAGMVNLTRSLARTYGPEGIRANVVAPGFTDTDMVSPVLQSERNPFADDATRFQISPLGRPGTPSEIADAIYFMAVTGTYCNGSVLVVDGGSMA